MLGQGEGYDKGRPTHRFTVQGVEWRTAGLGLLGNKLSFDLLTGIFHTLVIRGYKGVFDL